MKSLLREGEPVRPETIWWIGGRLEELDRLADLGLPLLGGLPFLTTRDGRPVLRLSGDIDLLAPWESRGEVLRRLEERGYRVVKRSCALSGYLVVLAPKDGGSFVSVTFHPFFGEHDISDRFGEIEQVSREWDYCNVSFIWRGVYARRLKVYLEKGLVSKDRLRGEILSSPYRELIAAMADESLVDLIPPELRAYRRRFTLPLAYLLAAVRVAIREPSWLACYIRGFNPVEKMEYLSGLRISMPDQSIPIAPEEVAAVVPVSGDDLWDPQLGKVVSLLRRYTGRIVVASSPARSNPAPPSVSEVEAEFLEGPNGKWASIAEAISRIEAPRYLILDSDMPVDEESLERLLSTPGDIVVPRRVMDSRSPVDRLLTLAFFLLTYPLGNRFRDVQAGAKVVSRRAAELIRDLPPYYLGDLLLVLRARRRGLVVREVPVRWIYDRPRSWRRRLRIIALMARDLVHLARRRG